MKKHFITLPLVIFFIKAASFGYHRSIPGDEVPYPEGYRLWTHVKTGLVGPSNPNFQFSGGYHHIYANQKAMQGYDSGYFPEGSVIVFDVLDTKEQNGNTQEAARNHLDVMVKDSLKYATTGGWGYEEFKGDSHTERLINTPALKLQCANCHARKEDRVFSEFRK